jgi:oxygen-independent coproporphyrinogen-3 oxidase
MAGLGVASFGHINGVHMQNIDTFEPYLASIEQGRIPLARALRPTSEETLIREFVLQMKLGSLTPAYFQTKYGVNVADRFAVPLASLEAEGYLKPGRERLTLTREGLLRVDSLLPRFFKPEHTAVRYT